MKVIHMIWLLAAIMFSSSVLAKGNHVDGLVKLPHPVQMIMKNKQKLGISEQQASRLKKEMLEVYPETIHQQMDEVADLEKQIRKQVLKKHKTSQQLKSQLDELASKKYRLTKTHIEALNTLNGILTEQQWQKVMKMVQKRQKNQHHHH